ncbi:MAG: 3-phosphoglycerate dehydrogenase [Clostridia bacterium]|nr:3-phosphoglycerate dehydrogenase [Clostridia bacterium]
MFNVKLLNSISNSVYDVLGSSYTLGEFENPDAILVRSANMHDYAIPESLLAVARAGAGVNNIPLEQMAEKGVVVFNTPGANANAVKELVVCALLLSCRKVYEGIKWAEGLKGADDAAKQVESGKKAFVGPEIFNKTLGIIGAGAIGGLVANAAIALGMKAVIYDPFLSDRIKAHIDQKAFYADSKEAVFEVSDFITLHLPLNDATRDTINAEAISIMKDGVRIINCARGELVNNDALKAALKSGKVAKYVTDFPNGEIIGEENVIAIPHLGASTPESEDNCAVMACEELKEYLENGNIINSVNMPSLNKQDKGKYRLTVIAKEDEQEAVETKAVKLKSTGSAKAVKKGYAYYIFDMDEYPDTEIVNAIPAVRKRLL